MLAGNRLFLRSFTSLSSLPPTIKQILRDIPNRTHSEGGHLATITVHGWIKSVRRQKNVSFAVVNDGTTLNGLQAVFSKPDGEHNTLLKCLTTGTSVSLSGKLVKSPGKGQEHELFVEKGTVLGDCDPDRYPIQKKDHSLEFLRDNTHLRPRTTNIAAMLRARHKLVRALGDWFENAGFVYAHAPIMTSNDCEGAGEAYRVVSDIIPPPPSPSSSPGLSDPHSTPTFLTTSTQLHLEAIASSLARVYTVAPSFRAERSQTNRHLSEFWMLEAEMSFLRTGIHGVCDVVEASLKSALSSLENDEDAKFLRKSYAPAAAECDLEVWLDPETPWRRITYSDALRALQLHHASGAQPRFQFVPPAWGEALRSEHERWIANSLGGSAGNANVGGPVFVTDYPRKLKPFYMYVNDEHADADGKDVRQTVACFDLLVPGLGELTGGSVRESRVEKLIESLAFHNMDEAHHSWYVDLRRYGTTSHGGFGIGIERLVSWFCGIENVRECIAFPRWAGKILL